jgi:hypothetical protein
MFFPKSMSNLGRLTVGHYCHFGTLCVAYYFHFKTFLADLAEFCIYVHRARICKPFNEPRNLVGRYDNPI